MTAGALLLAVLGTLGFVLLMGLLAAVVWLGVSQGKKGGRKTPEGPQEAMWAARVAALEVKVEALPGLWQEERRRSEAARERERYYATKSGRLRDDRGDEDEELEELSAGDAPPGPEQGVLPLLPGMDRAPAADEPHIARARAMGYPWTFLK